MAGGSGGTVATRNEPISLATLDRDCFIIPVHSVDRFLPAGIPVSIEIKNVYEDFENFAFNF